MNRSHFKTSGRTIWYIPSGLNAFGELVAPGFATSCRLLNFGKTSISLLIFLVAFFFLGRLFDSGVLAQTALIPPTFPSCSDRIFTSSGDWSSYDFGIHGIPGVGNLEGSDDVYSLGSGNFLQCFCPVSDTQGQPAQAGIQSNWWDVKNINKGVVDSFLQQGWFFEASGSGWNLLDDPYLIKNSNFSCEAPLPTPTPTEITTRVAESRCFDLEAQPEEGTAPLTVKFTAHADDPSSGGKIKEYRFDFDDFSGGQPQVWFQTERDAYHRYEISGTYTAKLRIQDSAGVWKESDDCRVTLKVHEKPLVLSASAPSQLPSAGSLSLIVLGLIPVGYYIYKHFRLE